MLAFKFFFLLAVFSFKITPPIETHFCSTLLACLWCLRINWFYSSFNLSSFFNFSLFCLGFTVFSHFQSRRFYGLFSCAASVAVNSDLIANSCGKWQAQMYIQIYIHIYTIYICMYAKYISKYVCKYSHF